MRFSERQGLKLEESSISIEDYKNMRIINRKTLASFLKDLSMVDIIDVESDEDESWNDECIDEEIKLILDCKENGQ